MINSEKQRRWRLGVSSRARDAGSEARTNKRRGMERDVPGRKGCSQSSRPVFKSEKAFQPTLSTFDMKAWRNSGKVVGAENY